MSINKEKLKTDFEKALEACNQKQLEIQRLNEKNRKCVFIGLAIGFMWIIPLLIFMFFYWVVV